MNIGKEMYQWAIDLFPLNRSVTGSGVRETLAYLKLVLPSIVIKDIPSGTLVFDWTVPDEWTIKNAWIKDDLGNEVVNFNNNNLHVIGYSDSIDKWLHLDDLRRHLYSLPEQPNAIPYVTSYYERRWGFCINHNQKEKLKPGRYHVMIDSELKSGVMNYAEVILPGESDKEVLLSTYICHPSMANNELSGPIVATALARWIKSLESNYYTYRIIFVPETIGSIAYLSRNVKHLKEKVVAGFNITCIGDNNNYSYLPSRKGNTFSDKVALHVLKNIDVNFKRYTWLDRGSDERQYCSPGIDLPIASIMRTKYGEYDEYHTSLDNLDYISSEGLEGGYVALQRSIEILENNFIYKTKFFGEPQLGKRGLYPTLGVKNQNQNVSFMMDVISFCDGEHSVIDIASLLSKKFDDVIEVTKKLENHGILLNLGRSLL